MRVEELEQALRTAADDQPPVAGDVDAVRIAGRRRQRMRAVGMSAVGITVLVVIGVSLVAWSGNRTDDQLTTDGAGAATGRWKQLPAPPLSPRSRVVGVWTGSEVLFVGGDTYLCPPGADCSGPTEPPLRDGAILDPTTETWRSIAPSPIPFSHAETAVVGDDVYFLLDPGLGGSRGALLRYSLDDDEWKELAVPPGDEALHSLLAIGDRVVAYSGSDERGEIPDQVYDPGSQSWSPLPADPLSPSFGRSMVWVDPHLYLFENELVAQPGSDGPSVTRGARLVLGTDDWERLPDSEILGSGGWYAEGNLLVNPQLGGADGGEVGNYGRTYPYGGIFDVETQTWIDLPDAPSEYSTGVVGDQGGLIYGNRGGLLLDLGSMRWIEMPALPGVGYDPYVSRIVVPAGRDAVSLGGEDWTDLEGKVLGDAWIWRSAPSTGSRRSR